MNLWQFIVLSTALHIITIIVLSMLLFGCGSMPEKGRPTGTPTYTPYQIEEMCDRQPDSEWCK